MPEERIKIIKKKRPLEFQEALGGVQPSALFLRRLWWLGLGRNRWLLGSRRGYRLLRCGRHGLLLDGLLGHRLLLDGLLIAFHRLLLKKDGLDAIRGLLEDVSEPPTRYVSVAGLMQQDLSMLKDGSLDDISRRMEDVERRLGLHRAGKVTRKKEDEIVAMLDKLIEELEKQGGT